MIQNGQHKDNQEHRTQKLLVIEQIVIFMFIKGLNFDCITSWNT